MIFDLITPCPKRPDIDCIAGAVAFAEFYALTTQTKAAPWLCGTPDGAAQFYIDKFPEIYWASDAEALSAQAYALIDFSTALPLPANLDLAKVKAVIDHRFLHQPANEFPNATIQLEAVGAAATLIAEKFQAINLTPSRHAAAMLHGAIHSNNLGFQSSLTTQRDLAAYAWLGTLLPDAAELISAYQAAHAAASLANLPETLHAEAKHYITADGVAYVFSQLELIDALSVWQNNTETLKKILSALAENIVLNIIDTSANISIVYTEVPEFNAKLRRNYGQDFSGDGALYLRPPQMRKQLALIFNSSNTNN